MNVGTNEQGSDAVAERELQSQLRRALLGGRWVLLLGEITVAALFFDLLKESLPADVVLATLLAYNALALWWLRRGRPVPGIRGLLLVLDTALVGLLSAVTGGIESPFAGLFYLVTLKAAIDYDILGGVSAAAAAVVILIAASSTATNVNWYDILLGHSGAQKIPYLLLIGVVAGYSTKLLKQFHQRRHFLEERLLRLQLSQEVQQREMEVARQVQRTILTAPPTHPLFDVSVHYEPAGDVGGDFYEFFFDPTRLAVVIGDVCGKGVSAALLSTSICYLSRSLRPLEDPRAYLAEVNRSLLEHSPESSFATATLAVLDGANCHAALYNAGHLPLLRVADGKVEQLHRPQFPLGIVSEVDYQPVKSSFRPGDMLVLYSDAFIEAQHAEGGMLGESGLEELVRRHAHLAPEDLVERVVEETRNFGTIRDDLTLIIVRRKPVPAL